MDVLIYGIIKAFQIYQSKSILLNIGDHALLDPFVEVAYAGYSARTSTKKNTYNPDWKEEIGFTEKFPSLCNRIAISVCDQGLKTERIATHFIEIPQIMDPSPDDSELVYSPYPLFE